ncbi:MAG: CDP-diacylglycerol--glycerol-3-phosphate 3-phosphatidyltransferase [Stellaceae bacterium]
MPINLPNLLTLSRIVAIPLVIVTFYAPAPYGEWVGCGLFVLAGITDWLDGELARRWHQQSEWGRVLDPIADKLLVASILFMLAALDRITPITLFPALIILAREILVSGLREHLAMLQVPVPVSRLAKWKTAIQMVAIGVLLVGNAGPVGVPVETIGELLLWVAAALTLITGYDYWRAGMSHLDDAAARAAKQQSTS